MRRIEGTCQIDFRRCSFRIESSATKRLMIDYLAAFGTTFFGSQGCFAFGPVSVSAAMPHSGAALCVVVGVWSAGTEFLPVVALLREVELGVVTPET